MKVRTYIQIKNVYLEKVYYIINKFQTSFVCTYTKIDHCKLLRFLM